MTTFLATSAGHPKHDDEYTLPYCSHGCLFANEAGDECIESVWYNGYEFDETCANCGKLIPAALCEHLNDAFDTMSTDYYCEDCGHWL